MKKVKKSFKEKMKQLFEDVPIWVNVINVIFIILWTLIDCYFMTLLSDLIASSINTGNDFLKAALIFIVYILGWELLEYVADIFRCMTNTYIENNAFKNTFNKLYTTSPEVLKKSNTGYISGLLHKLVLKKENAHVSMTEWLLTGSFFNIYIIFYVSKFSWWFSLILFVISVLGITTRIACLKINKKRVDKLSEVEAMRTKIFMDATTNMSTVQKLRSNQFMNNKMNEVNNSCFNAALKWTLVDDFFFCLYKIIMYMACPICLIAMFLIDDICVFDKVEFLAYLSIVEIKLVHYSKNIALAIKNYGLWRVPQDKIDSITDNQNKQYVSTSIEDNFETIELKDISHSYITEDKKSVTVNIPHFKVNKGDFVCICGESGQGKTTTLNILSGSIEGKDILVDGKITDKNIDAVYIAQDVEMFDMSLRDNLLLGCNASDEELINLIECVGLKEWFEKQKMGLDTILGERGVFVSTGQRQRLNLIRGLLIENKEIYLLDEPTSNVDEITEEKMISLIKDKLKNKTVIIVTHREKIKEICNKCYYFKNSTMYEGK